MNSEKGLGRPPSRSPFFLDEDENEDEDGGRLDLGASEKGSFRQASRQKKSSVENRTKGNKTKRRIISRLELPSWQCSIHSFCAEGYLFVLLLSLHIFFSSGNSFFALPVLKFT